MEIKNIKKNIEKALSDKELNLSYIDVQKGAIDEEEDRATFYTSIAIEPNLSNQEIEKAIHKIMPSEWCEHDFDCCGGWYRGYFRVVNKYPFMPNSGSYLVTVSWNKNI